MIAPTNSVAYDIKVKFTGHSTLCYLNWATFLWDNKRGCTPKQMLWRQNRIAYCKLLISVFHLQNTTLPTGQIETAKNKVSRFSLITYHECSLADTDFSVYQSHSTHKVVALSVEILECDLATCELLAGRLNKSSLMCFYFFKFISIYLLDKNLKKILLWQFKFLSHFFVDITIKTSCLSN